MRRADRSRRSRQRVPPLPVTGPRPAANAQNAATPTKEVHVITGAHIVVYSTDAEADRAFLRDLLGTTAVDAGAAG